MLLAVNHGKRSRYAHPLDVYINGLRLIEIPVALVALAIAHFLTILLTMFRLYNQARRLNILWYDDGFAAITASGALSLLDVYCLSVRGLIYDRLAVHLYSSVLHAPAPRPLEYHMVLASYFFVIWWA